MSPARAEKVWDVAALHGTGGISDLKSPETAVGSDAHNLVQISALPG
jgi:hypothetical protein